MGSFLLLSEPFDGNTPSTVLEPTIKKYFLPLQLTQSKNIFASVRFKKKVFKPFNNLFEAGLEKIFLPKNTVGLWSSHWKKIQKAFSIYLEDGPTSSVHSNKWARPLPLFFSSRRLLAKMGILLQDGYTTYPDHFVQGSSMNIFSRKDHNPWQLLNPPFNDTGSNALNKHIQFWMKHAQVSRSGHVLMFPHLPSERWYKQLWQNPHCTIALLKHPIWFLRLFPKMHFAGPARFRVILLLIGIRGKHFSLENDPLGFFSSENIDFKNFSLCFASKLTSYMPQKLPKIGPQLKAFLKELQVMENQRKEYAEKFTPAIDSPPQVNLLVYKNPMNWFGDSPPWLFKIHPQLKFNVYGPNLKRHKRWECAHPRYNYEIERTKNYLANKPRPFCQKCNKFHGPEACPLRIPSSNELGLFKLEDKLLYKFLLQIEILSPPTPSGDPDDPMTLTNFQALVETRKTKFFEKFKQFLIHQNYHEDFAIPERYSFARMRYSIAAYWALGYGRQDLVSIAFGVFFNFIEPPPPFECFSHQEVSPDLWELIKKRARQGRIQFIEKQQARVVMPIFELYSSGKTRLIQDSRWINLFLDPDTFELPTHHDALKTFDPNDFLFVLDFSSFWSQIESCPGQRFYFASAFKYKGQIYYFIYTGTSFGNCEGPRKATLLLKPACRVFSSFCPSVRFIDDGTGRLAACTTKLDALNKKASWCAWFWGTLGVFLNEKTFFEPRLWVKWCGKHLFSPLHKAFPTVARFEKLFTLLEETCAKGSTTPRNLAQILGLCHSTAIQHNPLLLREGFKLLAQTTALAFGRDNPIWNKEFFLTVDFSRVALLWVKNLFFQQKLPFVGILACELVLVSDAGGLRMGGVIFLRKKDQSHVLLHKMSENLPKVFQQCFQAVKFVSASVAREMLAIILLLQRAADIFSETLTDEIANEVSAIRIYTDSLGVAYAFLTKTSNNPTVQAALTDLERISASLKRPITIDWRSREEPLQKVADLLTRICDVTPSPFLKRLVMAKFSLKTWPTITPFTATDFVGWNPTIYSTEAFALVLVPPGLSFKAYESIVEFFFRWWQSPILLFIPLLNNNIVYQRLKVHSRPGPTFTWDRTFLIHLPRSFEKKSLICKCLLLHA